MTYAKWLLESLDHPTDACIDWPFPRTLNGNRGQLYIFNTTMAASKAALILASGEWLEGLDALHVCDNANCVNPRHLVWGTHAENMADKKGHSRRRNLSESELSQILALDAAGVTRIRIAELFKVSPPTITNAIKRRGGPVNGYERRYLKGA